MIDDKTTKNQLPFNFQIEIAFNILNFNQSLIQFVESKASNLLLINSIYIGSLVPFSEKLKSANFIQISVTIILGIIILLNLFTSLSIISTFKRESSVEDFNNSTNTHNLIFYKNVIDHTNVNSYISDFKLIDAQTFLTSILNSIYTNSEIAKNKYDKFNLALWLTKLATLLWIINMISFMIK